jgi:8-oxo-dGTP diphosphatase
MLLGILNANTEEPTNYALRKTVKAVVVNKEGNVALFSGNLIGGGVEEGETNEQALHREALEEAGMEIEICKPLGEVIQYRDVLQKKYVVHGYACNYVAITATPTLEPEERGMKISWMTKKEAISLLESEINALKNANSALYPGDMYQSKLYNRIMSLTFLKQDFTK